MNNIKKGQIKATAFQKNPLYVNQSLTRLGVLLTLFYYIIPPLIYKPLQAWFSAKVGKDKQVLCNGERPETRIID